MLFKQNQCSLASVCLWLAINFFAANGKLFVEMHTTADNVSCAYFRTSRFCKIGSRSMHSSYLNEFSVPQMNYYGEPPTMIILI